jgi:hypothetical protein
MQVTILIVQDLTPHTRVWGAGSRTTHPTSKPIESLMSKCSVYTMYTRACITATTNHNGLSLIATELPHTHHLRPPF